MRGGDFFVPRGYMGQGDLVIVLTVHVCCRWGMLPTLFLMLGQSLQAVLLWRLSVVRSLRTPVVYQ